MDLITAALNSRDDKIASLEKRVIALREALKFYANEWGYRGIDSLCWPCPRSMRDIWQLMERCGIEECK